MLTDELTVFDIKYNEGMDRLNNLLSEESNFNSIKNYVERYKLDRSRENRISQKNNTNAKTSQNINKEDKRKQIVDIYEIRDHEKKVQHYFNKNYLKNEIEWFKIKKREDEHKNKYNYNKTKFDNMDYNNSQLDYNKDIARTNNIKMKKFSNLANKVNIDKIIQLKKLNQNQKQYSNSEKKNKNNNNKNNNIEDGVFIPYAEFLQNELNNKNKTKINIKKINNFNPKKNEKLPGNQGGGGATISKNSNKTKNMSVIPNKSYNLQKKTFTKNNLKNNNSNKSKQNINNNLTNNNNLNNNNKKNFNNFNIQNNLNNNNNGKVHYIYNNVRRFNISQSNIINNRNMNNNNSQSLSAKKNGNVNGNKVSQSEDNNNQNNKRNKNTAPIYNDIRYKIDIRKPLDKKIDYLRERNTSPEQRIKIYDSKKMKDKKNVLDNIEILNLHSKMYEDEAKRQELLMRVKGNKKYGNEDNIKLSNLLIDSISTKLAILNQITTHDK